MRVNVAPAPPNQQTPQSRRLIRIRQCIAMWVNALELHVRFLPCLDSPGNVFLSLGLNWSDYPLSKFHQSHICLLPNPSMKPLVSLRSSSLLHSSLPARPLLMSVRQVPTTSPATIPRTCLCMCRRGRPTDKVVHDCVRDGSSFRATLRLLLCARNACGCSS